MKRPSTRGAALFAAVMAVAAGGSIGWQALRDDGSDPGRSTSAAPVEEARPDAARPATAESARVRVLPGSGRVVRSSDAGGISPREALRAARGGTSLVARPTRPGSGPIRLYRSARDRRPWRTLSARTPTGVPRVLLVRAAAGDRFQVSLPIRPNGSTAWVDALQVRVALVGVSVDVDLSSRRLVVRRGKRRVVRAPIGVGRSITPTPSGTYYVTALLKQRNPRGAYGPFALALSGHSPVLTEFDGGRGRIGIHGTSDPSGIGGRVSHGCLRVRNRVVRRLARLLPLGAPVRITR
jgi:lipoprotein-anchoring transpeptidase ErfK/SrfK